MLTHERTLSAWKKQSIRILSLPPSIVLTQDIPRLCSYVLIVWCIYLRYPILIFLERKNQLPQLNQAQITKLKHLSIVSLAAERRVSIVNLLTDAIQ